MVTLTDLLSQIEEGQRGLRARPFQREVKRVLDIAGAAAMLILLSPLLLLIALCVKLDDGGPVFYRRRVVGQRGEFDAFKFRTMRPDASVRLGQTDFPTDHLSDTRVIPT
jgi:lipopolysaccharide/colanic/teichoic acid biosynthesis glycosyltransferase